MPEILLWHWFAFGGLVAGLLALDLLVFHRRLREPTLRESAAWTLFWCCLAAAFNVFLWWWRGPKSGLNFLTGYLVEWSLSMDNVFVFAVIFRYFQTPRIYQYRVLFWGILGAVFMRLGFILAGAETMDRFAWVKPLFGLFLLFTAGRLALGSQTQVDPEKNLVLRIARRVFPVSRGSHREHAERFVVREAGRLVITPLLLVLLVVESTDVLFAVDSVPAILGITSDRFVVFTSNIFAILGLRALYFLLAGMIDLFRYLNYGLSAVLAFVGGKMVAEYWVAGESGELVPAWVSLAVVVGLLAISIVASIVYYQPGPREGDSLDKTDD